MGAATKMNRGTTDFPKYKLNCTSCLYRYLNPNNPQGTYTSNVREKGVGLLIYGHNRYSGIIDHTHVYISKTGRKERGYYRSLCQRRIKGHIEHTKKFY